MLQENVLPIIDKLINSKITISEIETIAPLLGDSDFKEAFQLIEDLEQVVQPIGRSQFRKLIKASSNEYHREMNVIEHKNKFKWKLPAVAACFLAIVCVSTYSIVKDSSSKNVYNSRSVGGGSFETDPNPDVK